MTSNSRQPYITTGSIYAVLAGKFLGKTLVYIKRNKQSRCFLSLPEMKNHDIPEDTFRHGLEREVLDKIEKLPEDIFEVCKAQYEKNINT
jgi:hypothetical protein